MDEFNRQCVDKHNYFRTKHGCPPVEFSEELRRTAQQWADHLAETGKLEHCPESHGKRGENVAMKQVQGGTEFNGSQVTCQWYSEIGDFTFGVENQINCGHFSQVVWKDTKKCGFGRATHKSSGKVFIVGQYLPGANMMNKWNANIPPPVNGKVECPTREDYMGPAPPASRSGGSGGGGGGGGLQGEGKHGPDDVLVSKQTKSRTSGGVKTITIIETYQRPDGTTFQATIEKKQG